MQHFLGARVEQKVIFTNSSLPLSFSAVFLMKTRHQKFKMQNLCNHFDGRKETSDPAVGLAYKL